MMTMMITGRCCLDTGVVLLRLSNYILGAIQRLHSLKYHIGNSGREEPASDLSFYSYTLRRCSSIAPVVVLEAWRRLTVDCGVHHS